MQYNASTPEEYLAQLEPDWRNEKLNEVRDLIFKHGPEMQEGIEYKMLSYGSNELTLFNLNAQKGYVSLYVGHIDKVADARELLSPFDLGKGCIRIKKSVKLEETQLETFIMRAIETWRAGNDIGC